MNAEFALVKSVSPRLADCAALLSLMSQHQRNTSCRSAAMPFLSILVGALLIALGLQGYFDFGDLLGVEKQQITALIPAGVGAALVLLGLIALGGPGARKNAMHLAALVGLLGLAGALFRPVQAMSNHNLDLNKMPTRLQLAMAGLCLAFLLMCIQSFINARRVRGFANGQ